MHGSYISFQHASEEKNDAFYISLTLRVVTSLYSPCCDWLHEKIIIPGLVELRFFTICILFFLVMVRDRLSILFPCLSLHFLFSFVVVSWWLNVLYQLCIHEHMRTTLLTGLLVFSMYILLCQYTYWYNIKRRKQKFAFERNGRG